METEKAKPETVLKKEQQIPKLSGNLFEQNQNTVTTKKRSAWLQDADLLLKVEQLKSPKNDDAQLTPKTDTDTPRQTSKSIQDSQQEVPSFETDGQKTLTKNQKRSQKKKEAKKKKAQ